MQVENDQFGAVLACELQPERALHRGDQLDVALAPQDPVDEREV
ncbi:MAG: hypothetical protein ABSG43_27870 [Solirubrobacteraceae bacterium]